MTDFAVSQRGCRDDRVSRRPGQVRSGPGEDQPGAARGRECRAAARWRPCSGRPLFDEITAADAPAGEYSITVSGPQAHLVPTDDSNLAIRAARAVAGLLPDPGRVGVRLHIAKEIPVAGGMAGGSADAAGALLACAALWGVDASADDLVGLASGLGADVPFCLVGNTALGTGRGDVVTPVLTRGTYHWVVALVDYELSPPGVRQVRRVEPGRPDPCHPRC